jgi:UDP-2-acetamido-2,6-beta-L-arabino-hexul-4-ose reductase
MKVLVTGANGFIGKNLIARLQAQGNCEVLPFDINTNESLLDSYCKQCSFVFHLAGINRPQNASEFMHGNFGFTVKLLEKLSAAGNKSPVLLTSSTQAVLDNDYGKSKLAGEDFLRNYGIKNNIKTYIFRLPNVFGKWCKPNYNSAVATFCFNIANGLPITINNRETELTLVYIDDVVDTFIDALNGKFGCQNDILRIPTEHKATLGYIADLLNGFVESRLNLFCPAQAENSFEKKLYSTYLSYLPKDKFSYELKMNVDDRGSFTEFLKTLNFGQVSINISKPNITKGDHWHDSKNEKFLVVSGKGVIRFRKIGCDEIIEIFVSGNKLQVVDIPCGYTHNIQNLGDTDMVTVMWANEIFNKDKPDTVFLKV